MGLEGILTPEQYESMRSQLQEVRGLHSAYFERLVLLNGATVGLVVTVVLGQLHSQLKHKYTLGIGLTSLVLAMACLMIRNYYAVRMEMAILVRTFRTSTAGEPDSMRWISRGFVDRWAYVGSGLTIAGLFILLLEVWMILW